MGGMKDLFGDTLYEMRRPESPGDRGKREGMERVTGKVDPVWWARVMDACKALPPGWVGIGEDLRHHWEEIVGPPLGLANPDKIVGPVISAVRRLGWFAPTGNWRKPKDAASHSRPTQEYRRT